jgi:hypothetical protein
MVYLRSVLVVNGKCFALLIRIKRKKCRFIFNTLRMDFQKIVEE